MLAVDSSETLSKTAHIINVASITRRNMNTRRNKMVLVKKKLKVKRRYSSPESQCKQSDVVVVGSVGDVCTWVTCVRGRVYL